MRIQLNKLRVAFGVGHKRIQGMFIVSLNPKIQDKALPGKYFHLPWSNPSLK